MDFSILILVRPSVSVRGLSQKSKQNGKQCISWWDGSLWAVSSGSILFEKQKKQKKKKKKKKKNVCLVCRTERVKINWGNLKHLIIEVHTFYWDKNIKKKKKKKKMSLGCWSPLRRGYIHTLIKIESKVIFLELTKYDHSRKYYKNVSLGYICYHPGAEHVCILIVLRWAVKAYLNLLSI